MKRQALLRARRKFRPVVDSPLENRALLSITPNNFLPQEINSIWSQGGTYQPQAQMSYQTVSTTTPTGSTQTSGNTTTTSTGSIVVNDSGSQTGGQWSLMQGGSWIVSVDNHTVTTTSTTTTDTADNPSIVSHATETNDVELVETSTQTTAGTTVTFTYTTKITAHNDGTTTPAGSSTPSNTVSTDITYTLVQQGTLDIHGVVTGTFTLTSNGDDGLETVTTTSSTGETDTSDLKSSDTWSLNATGNLASSTAGTVGYTMTYTGNTSNVIGETSGSSTPGAASASASYNDSNKIQINATGTGQGASTNNYTLAQSGSANFQSSQTMLGTASSVGVMLSATTTIKASTSYTLNDSGTGGTSSTESGNATIGMNATVSDSSGSVGFNDSDTSSFNFNATAAGVVTLTGTLFALNFKSFDIAALWQPPAVPAIYFMNPTPKEAYYNYLAYQYNIGNIWWPFKGDPPLQPLPANLGNLPVEITENAPTVSGFLGTATLPSAWWSGIVIIPYTGPPAGYVWQEYWLGYKWDQGIFH